MPLPGSESLVRSSGTPPYASKLRLRTRATRTQPYGSRLALPPGGMLRPGSLQRSGITAMRRSDSRPSFRTPAMQRYAFGSLGATSRTPRYAPSLRSGPTRTRLLGSGSIFVATVIPQPGSDLLYDLMLTRLYEYQSGSGDT